MLPVASVYQGRIGFIALPSDAWYQAELGLASADGGWLMLARSNRLPLLAPMRVDRMGALGATERSATERATAPVAVIAAVSPAVARLNVGKQRGNRVDGAPVWQAGTDADREPGGVANKPLACPVIPVAGAVLDARGKGARQAENAAKNEQGNEEPANRDSANNAHGSVPAPGSGPIESIREAADTALWGRLRIGGRAAPGTLLELGGHPYRVGPGGRFAFDLAISDPDLIHALLRLLPVLPVAQREEE